MNRSLSLIALMMASAMPAFGADVVAPPPFEPPAPPPPAAFDWTGVYVGALAGYHWTDTDPHTFRVVQDHIRIDNWLGGGFVGANYQFENNLVVGIEGEFDYLAGSGNENLQVVISNKVETAEGKLDLGWSGSLRGRFGYAYENTMLFGTAGGELASGHGTGSFNGQSIDTGTRTVKAWTVGAGIEHAFTDNFFARAEYRYSYYPKISHDFSWDKDFSIEASRNKFQVGLGYKF